MPSPSRVSTLLFLSGACALIYQVAWFRELRLIFGVSTGSQAAVLAIFMGGLGLGGAVIGKRADRTKNPLALYATLEILVAIAVGISPALVWLARAIYLALGGSAVLGVASATLVRIVLSVVVLGPATFLMGGTLPAAARALATKNDESRKRVATLYGVNTLGAVVGALAANFLLLEVFGTRLTLWLACLVNLLVGLGGRVLARGVTIERESDGALAPADASGSDRSSTIPGWLPPFAAGVAGFSFMLMELVWYRMLAPILGGTSYTFGLILALALLGIGIGGLLYGTGRIAPSVRAFALSCGLEALAIALPYALGDRLAIFALTLRPLCNAGFGAAVLAWSAVASIVVVPAAIVSGAQFPLVIGLYGKRAHELGRDVGRAYFANTLGAIGGALAGGFGLIPLFSAPTCWRMVVELLVVASVVALASDRARLRKGLFSPLIVASVAIVAVFLCTRDGPSALWRHRGIGAGRLDYVASDMSPASIEQLRRDSAKSRLEWAEDGVESAIALDRSDGFTFVVNGKADGHAINDAPTQVMSGLLTALLHPNPRRAMVVGLGTGSSAGWLAAIPSMERVDVVELEPAILRVARDCAPVNHDAMENPKLHVTLGDAREALLTTPARYDVIFSEPSNPYRAGISSLYTTEFYGAIAAHLEKGGVFVQWVQAYEIDLWAIATVLRTLHENFPELSVWSTVEGDLLITARREHVPIDADDLRRRSAEEPFSSALRNVWRTSSPEGILAHHVAGERLAGAFEEQGFGAVNTDDDNLLEFAFARNLGGHRDVVASLVRFAQAKHVTRPEVTGAIDWTRVDEERAILEVAEHFPPDAVGAARSPSARAAAEVIEGADHHAYASALAAVRALHRPPRNPREEDAFAAIAIATHDPNAQAMIDAVGRRVDRAIFQAKYAIESNDAPSAAASLEQAFTLMRTDPWTPKALASEALELAVRIARDDATLGRRLFDALGERFAVDAHRTSRLGARVLIAYAVKDLPRCVAALAPYEPEGLWDRTQLQERVGCYASAHDPRAGLAAEDLALFYRLHDEVLEPHERSDVTSPSSPKHALPNVDGGP